MNKKILDEAHRCVGNEIKHQNFDATCLSKALMESHGNHELAMSLYVKMRLEMIQHDVLEKQIRDKNLSNRQLQSVTPHSDSPPPDQISKPRYEWITVCICHATATFSFFGIIWTANIILGKKHYIPNDIGVLIGMIMVNLIPLSGYFWIKLYFEHIPYQKIAICYAILLGIISFLMGIKLLY